jgi:hypothetical protein
MDETVQDDAPVAPNLDKMAAVYLKIRDAKDALTNEYKKAAADFDAQMDVLEAEMLEVCKAMNASSIRTSHGTVIRSVKSKYWTGDWDSMYRFIKEHDAFGLLEKRLHQTNMKEFLTENPDTFPIGMNVENAFTVIVRRAKGN